MIMHNRLNPTGQAIAINSTFESIFGPLYKFKEWDFANAATEDVDPANTQGGDTSGKLDSNRAKFRNAIAKVRASLTSEGVGDIEEEGSLNDHEPPTMKIRNVEMLTLGTNDSGLPRKHHFDWTIGSIRLENGDDYVILYGDMVNELEHENR